MGLKAVVKTPGVEGEPPDEEEIDLPPREMWGELMGQPAAKGVPHPEMDGLHNHHGFEVKPDVVAPAAKAEVAKLEFIGDRVKIVSLQFPFIWEGKEVSEIKIRRLTLGMVSEIVNRPTGVKLTTFDIFARMTDFPAAVLRGLDSEDGEAVSTVAMGFLPRSLRMGES